MLPSQPAFGVAPGASAGKRKKLKKLQCGPAPLSCWTGSPALPAPLPLDGVTNTPRLQSPALLAVCSCHRVTGPLLGASGRQYPGGGLGVTTASHLHLPTWISFSSLSASPVTDSFTVWPSWSCWVSWVLFFLSSLQWLENGVPMGRRDCKTSLADFRSGHCSVIWTDELSCSSSKPHSPGARQLSTKRK